VRNPRLLWQFTRSEGRDKYRGTLFGGLWAYSKPLTRFLVYFLVIGVLLGLSRRVENFPVYIFSGVVVLQFFTSSLTSGTKSLAKQTSLMRRVNVAREFIPLSTVLVNVQRLRPAMIILVGAALLTGWRPSHVAGFPEAIAGMILLMVFAGGLVMVTGVANMYVRDTRYAVESVIMVASWASPTIYPWNLVAERYGEHSWISYLYLSNPVTIAMFGMRAAFWEPTVPLAPTGAPGQFPDEPLAPGGVLTLPLVPVLMSIAVTIATFLLGLSVVRKHQHNLLLRTEWTP
jgi:ABC-2 type transport system permease protein